MRTDDDHARDLVARLAAGVASGPEQYDLLQAVYAGFPVSQLGPMVNSSDVGAVRAAATILAESGDKVAAVPGFVDSMLAHSDAKVRYYAIQAILGSGSPLLSLQAARAVELIEDESRAVRRSALRLIAFAPEEQLRAASHYLGPSLRELLTRVLAAGAERQLDAADRTSNLMQLAEALRHFGSHPDLIQTLLEHEDPEVREFALLEAENLGIS